MTNRPGLTGRKLVASLSNKGFTVVRTKGSRHFLRHPDGRSTVVPVHAVKGRRAREPLPVAGDLPGRADALPRPVAVEAAGAELRSLVALSP